MFSEIRRRVVSSRAAIEWLSQDSRSVVLVVEPGLGGGVERHVHDLAALLQDRCNFVRLAPTHSGTLQLVWRRGGQALELYFETPRELSLLNDVLKSIGVTRVHIHHTLRLPRDILQLPLDLDVPFDYTVHDYTSFCPQITLTDRHFNYCGEPDELGCQECLKTRPARSGENISEWRRRFAELLSMADRVFVPTRYVEARIRKHFPNLRIVVASHPETGLQGLSAPRALSSCSGGEPLRVLLLGALNAIKGADMLEFAALDAQKRKLPIEYHLLGYAYRSLIAFPASHLWMHGRYDKANLRPLIATISPHIAWFPTHWPETYSYTLSEVLELGIPVTATNLGAIEERLRGRESNWILPWQTSYTAWNDFFMRLRAGEHDNEFSATRRPAFPPPKFSYEGHYIMAPKTSTPSSRFPDETTIRKLSRAYRPTIPCAFACLKSWTHEFLRWLYRFQGARSLVIRVIPEYRIQQLRRWLGGY